MKAKRMRVAPPWNLHFELWVSNRKDRTRISNVLRRLYSVARRITQDRGGFGPWLYLADHDPRRTKSVRLRRLLGLRTDEDLWVELAFYSSRKEMRATIREIWKLPKFQVIARPLDRLLSRRKPGYDATIALLTLQRI